MTNLQFQVNEESDINIWLRFLKSNKATYGLNFLELLPKEFLSKLLNKSEKEQKEIILEHIKQYYTEENLNKFRIDSYNKIKDKFDLIIERLEQIHNKKLPVKRIIVKYTTFTACPYIYQGKKSQTYGLYLNNLVIENNIQIMVFSHEVIHLFFHYYFEDYCLDKGLSKNQTSDLKEAITVLLNLELKDIIEIEDKGYLDHISLRQVISEIWQSQPKDKDFLQLLDNVIKIMKEEQIEELDLNGNVIAIHPKSELKKRMFIHRCSLIIPRTFNNKFLLSKRSKKQQPFPDTWICCVGGKVLAGESYLDGAIREGIEEINSSLELEEVCFFFYDQEDYKAFFKVYTTKEEIDPNCLKPNPEEIQYIKAFSIEEIKEKIETDPNSFAPTFREAIKCFVKASLII
jgi:isopentenyldiphosphate isomerase